MRPSSVETFSPDQPDLHPVLRKALDNLDVQLEDELTRYRQRRYRQSGKKTTVQDLERSHRRPELSQAPLPPALPSHTPDYPNYADAPLLEGDLWASEVAPSTFDPRRVVREMRPTPNPDAPPPPPQRAAPLAVSQPELTDDYYASSEELLKSFSQPEAAIIRRQSTLLDTLLTPLGVGSMLLLLLSSVSLGYMLMNPSSLGFITAIGRSKTDPSITPAPGSNQSLSPDLASEEFIDVNLNTLSQLPRHARSSTIVTIPQTASPTLLPGVTPPNDDNTPRLSAAVATDKPLETVAIPSSPVVPQSVSQAAPQSAPQSTSRSTSQSAPARSAPARPAAQPAAAPQPSARTATITVPPPPTVTAYVAPAPAPQPAPEPAYAPPISTRPPSSTISQAPPTDRYYVVTDYTGDPSLSQAREAIRDAYVRNFDDGAKVQMGAFGDSASAEQMAQRLQQQGVPARVYQP
jgi:hypothetical protein